MSQCQNNRVNDAIRIVGESSRYTGWVENLDELRGSIGLNIGLNNGLHFNLEYTRNSPSDQLLLTMRKRY